MGVPEINGSTSDGHHTFDELYMYRMLYNAALFNEWGLPGQDPYDVHKSYYHSDGELCFGGGWFIVVAELPTGQISNHYKTEHWDLFNIKQKLLPNEYDGHTPADVAKRLLDFLKEY
jgi:hypothetical protein